MRVRKLNPFRRAACGCPRQFAPLGIIVRHDRNLVLPGIGFLERNQHGSRAGRRVLVLGDCRVMGHARQYRDPWRLPQFLRQSDLVSTRG
jgi:hypothetical protein